jgi:hypothetical protein
LTRDFSWHHDEVKEASLQKGLPVPDEAVARERVLGKDVEAPDLATVKDFLRFHAATSKGKIVERPTSESLNTFAEWFFAGFERITGTPTDADDRSEVYNVSSIFYRHLSIVVTDDMVSGCVEPRTRC